MTEANAYVATRTITISAEQGTSMMVPSISPPTLQAADTPIDMNIMFLNRLLNNSAVIWGNASIDISNIMPTSLMVSTMHTATNTVMV